MGLGFVLCLSVVALVVPMPMNDADADHVKGIHREHLHASHCLISLLNTESRVYVWYTRLPCSMVQEISSQRSHVDCRVEARPVGDICCCSVIISLVENLPQWDY